MLKLVSSTGYCFNTVSVSALESSETVDAEVAVEARGAVFRARRADSG